MLLVLVLVLVLVLLVLRRQLMLPMSLQRRNVTQLGQGRTISTITTPESR